MPMCTYLDLVSVDRHIFKVYLVLQCGATTFDPIADRIVSGGVRQSRMKRAVILMLPTVAMLAKNVASFNMAPNPVSRNGDVGNTVRASSHVTHLPMAKQRSAPLDVVDDTTDTAGLADVARAVFAEDKRPVLLYDGVCNMCNGFVNRFLDIDKEEKFRFSALQSETGRSLLSLSGRSPDDISRSVYHRHTPRIIHSSV